MKYWIHIKAKLKDKSLLATQLLLAVIGVYTITMGQKNREWKVPILFIGLLFWFFLRKRIKHPIIWIVSFGLLSVDLYFSYFSAANHHFMLMFMTLSVILYSYHQRHEILEKNIQLLVVIVLLGSVLQKLMSTQFMEGDFFYYMLNRGYLFKNFHDFFPNALEIASNNRKNVLAFQATDPNLRESIVLENIFPNLGLFSLIFAWGTVALESVVGIAILLKPRSKATHLLFIVMIVGVLLTNLETGFMALLAICGIFLCRNIYLRFLYVLICMACITLIITKIGFH